MMAMAFRATESQVGVAAVAVFDRRGGELRERRGSAGRRATIVVDRDCSQLARGCAAIQGNREPRTGRRWASPGWRAEEGC